MEWKRYGWLGLAALGVGCSGTSGLPENQPVQMEARLEHFEGCESLEAYIENTAVKQMRADMEMMKPSRQPRGGWWGGIPVMTADGSIPPNSTPGAPEAGGSAGGPTRQPRGPGDYTDTNNQVAGVDEADFVKNDGTRIFVLSGQRLYAHSSWPASELSLRGSVAVEGWPREMFLEGNTVVVFSSVYQALPGGGSSGGTGSGASTADVMCSPMWCGSYGSNVTKVTTVDVSKLSEPRVVGELFLPGGYLTARRVERTVRLVQTDSFRWPAEVRWWPELSSEDWSDEGKVERAIDTQMAANERIIRAQSLASWMPESKYRRADGTEVSVGYDCRDFHRGNTPSRLGFVTVTSLDMDAPEPAQAPSRTSLVAEPGQVYASAESLYLASPHGWWWPEDGQKNYTYVHKFDTRDAHRASYVASGTIEGHLLDSFSMDEYQGVLRVATTTSQRVVDLMNPWGRMETSNRVSTFEQKGGKLKPLGQSEELAKGERIYSARFMGPRGYVVTFRQVDPLFTFDLSNPAQPRKVGELKVPGFSTYIHPLDEGHLLTIGVQMPENGGWERSLKLSLFDVTDMANPRETFTQVVGTAYGWSEAQYEHKAFNYFPAKGLLAIPFADWRYDAMDYWSGFVSELRVFRVNAATGFAPVGALSMSDVYQTYGRNEWTWYWTPHVRRSVMADDYVYAISDAGVRASHVNALGTPLATTRFQPAFPSP